MQYPTTELHAQKTKKYDYSLQNIKLLKEFDQHTICSSNKQFHMWLQCKIDTYQVKQHIEWKLKP